MEQGIRPLTLQIHPLTSTRQRNILQRRQQSSYYWLLGISPLTFQFVPLRVLGGL
jgi:hypothetical protein